MCVRREKDNTRIRANLYAELKVGAITKTTAAGSTEPNEHSPNTIILKLNHKFEKWYVTQVAAPANFHPITQLL